uniref:Transcription initiation factor IIB n=1 Tax=Arion vulgaris TaxID=1028688 RepID=A0A0B6YT01_9EUPU
MYPEHLKSRFCSNLGLSSTIQKTARYIASKAVELDLVPGRNPVSVTAAAIYMASQTSGNKKTAKEIGEIAGVAEVTLLQSYKLMLPRTGDLMPTKC